MGRGSKSLAFGQKVNLDAGFPMQQFGPAAGELRRHLKPTKVGGAKKLINAVGCDGDIDVLRQTTVKPVTPDGPSSP
jgi:hypothetical protein